MITPALRIRARREGFRRAGMAHSAAPVLHPAGTFTPDQVAALLAEAMLDVAAVPSAASGGGTTPPPAGAAPVAETAATAAVGPVAPPTAGDLGGGVAGTHADGEAGKPAARPKKPKGD